MMERRMSNEVVGHSAMTPNSPQPPVGIRKDASVGEDRIASALERIADALEKQNAGKEVNLLQLDSSSVAEAVFQSQRRHLRAGQLVNKLPDPQKSLED